jgi:hypothetical protein
MLVARQGRKHREVRERLTRATSASRCSLAPPRAPRRPWARSCCLTACIEVRRVRDARCGTGPPEQSRARATYLSDVSVALLLSASESAVAPASPIRLITRLQRGEEGQRCSWRDRATDKEQGVRDLLERRQRRVALERLRERRSARLADLVVHKAAAKSGGSGMLVARRGQTAQSRARATYHSDVSVALFLSASESAAAPASQILLLRRLQRGEEGQR